MPQATRISRKKSSSNGNGSRRFGILMYLFGKPFLVLFKTVGWFSKHVARRPKHFGVGLLSLALIATTANIVSGNATAAVRQETRYITVTTSEAFQSAADESELLVAEGATYQVNRGDTLASIFQKVGLGSAVVHEVVNETPDGNVLTKIIPGQSITIAASDGHLQSLTYDISKTERFEIQNMGYGLESYFVEQQPERFRSVKSGVISSSLFVDAQKSGLSSKTIMEMANIFGWDIDFALDIRKDDTFLVVYEELFIDGEKIGDGNILAAEFVNQGDQIRAVRYEAEDGRGLYYTPEGESMRKTFLRAPVDFRRISSNFNPNRLHPIYKTVRPHRGIDYAADRGTPVFSSGDGKVIASSYTDPNGKYVFIQHGQKYVTKYLHLDTRSVQVGQEVRQGQIIGTVGSTGSATGPHLHYEFLVNGVHMNPRTVDLPNGDPIASEELARFEEFTAPALALLESSSVKYASTSNE